MRVEFKLVNTDNSLFLPKKETQGAAGYDVRANIEENIRLWPGDQKLISLGFAMHIHDPGVAAIILPRSGLGAKQGLVIGNLTGLIDSDYQGELSFMAWYRPISGRAADGITIHSGDRIGQMIFVPVLHPIAVIVNEFSRVSDRGDGGYGSTGVY